MLNTPAVKVKPVPAEYEVETLKLLHVIGVVPSVPPGCAVQYQAELPCEPYSINTNALTYCCQVVEPTAYVQAPALT